MRQAVIIIAICSVLLFCSTLLYRYFARSKTMETDGKTDKSTFFAEQRLQAVPNTANLYSFFWSQSSSNADKCFIFSFGAAQWDAEAEGHYLNCEFLTPNGEFAEYRDVAVMNGQWTELEKALRSISLPSYAPPDENLADATYSCVEVSWMENDCRFTNRYNGEYAHELYAFLIKIIGQITK